ncbi:MAG: hypothetical protein VKL59_00345 [Nostocaceae cyanobacterium]|nr:hypothetical protein [Nostocaceae cyanobacterium]
MLCSQPRLLTGAGQELLAEQRQQYPCEHLDVLSILLNAKDKQGNPLGRADIKENILGMLIPGHETLTSP